jgi:hypothetical protein
MASENTRWRNIREFLDDLPSQHCHVKPGHEFCTVCMRINYLVAQDCPLYHQKPKRKKKVPPPAPPEARPEPIKDHLSADDVKQALKGEDFPIIEFAGPRGTGGHSKDEKVFEVKPFDVKPIAAPPPEAIKKSPKKEPEEDEAKPAKPATAVADRDPESIVQEIMEELEFPDGAPIDDEVEQDEGADPDEEGDDDGKGDEKKEEERPKEDKPPVVKKEAVKKRRPKKK